jgi:hypothetical protein
MPKLQIKILEDKQSLGRTTAEHAARSLRVAIRDRGLARIIAGASQFEFLEAWFVSAAGEFSDTEMVSQSESLRFSCRNRARSAEGRR